MSHESSHISGVVNRGDGLDVGEAVDQVAAGFYLAHKATHGVTCECGHAHDGMDGASVGDASGDATQIGVVVGVRCGDDRH